MLGTFWGGGGWGIETKASLIYTVSKVLLFNVVKISREKGIRVSSSVSLCKI